MSYHHITLFPHQQLRIKTRTGLVQVDMARRDANPFVDLLIELPDDARAELVPIPTYDPAPRPRAQGQVRR